ncbi:MAG TPA: DUF4291 family protein [Saprospiraceae bacterium]|nr:DUF4291 family protein [Saprospiraceae bacterium]
MKRQSANLNIRYDFPIWDYRVPAIFSKTEGWIKDSFSWFSLDVNEKHVSASIEPAGLAFNGLMEDEEWHIWIQNIKEISTQILGYKIGEIETGEVGHNYEWIDNLSIFEEYSNVIRSKNPKKLRELYESAKKGLSEIDIIEIEKAIFRNKDNDCHDSIASGFQTRSHPMTAKFLFEQIKSNTIPQFDYKPVTRKCVWALADIGTEESKKYLSELAQSEDEIVRGFALKRLDGWEKEFYRKGRMINCSYTPHRKRIKLIPYHESELYLPQSGNVISAYQTENEIVLYQAYKPSIAKFAVENQKLGGPDFSFSRMTWVKPNYLWMMYRSGWAVKEDQERILAIRISKTFWEEILSKAVFSSFKPEFYKSYEVWKRNLERSDVRLQWDPNHDPFGNKKERKAIQIGMRGEVLINFVEQITMIEDITPFVDLQRIFVNHGQIQHLEIPHETEYKPRRNDLRIGIH